MTHQYLSLKHVVDTNRVNLTGGIFYTPDIRCFTDHNGVIVIDLPILFNWFEIEQWLLLCEQNDQCYGQVQAKNGSFVEFFYLRPVDYAPDQYLLNTNIPYYDEVEMYLHAYIDPGIKKSILERRYYKC